MSVIQNYVMGLNERCVDDGKMTEVSFQKKNLFQNYGNSIAAVFNVFPWHSSLAPCKRMGYVIQKRRRCDRFHSALPLGFYVHLNYCTSLHVGMTSWYVSWCQNERKHSNSDEHRNLSGEPNESNHTL